MATKNNLEKDINTEIREVKAAQGKKGFKAWFEKAAASITKATGSSTAFLLAVAGKKKRVANAVLPLL